MKRLMMMMAGGLLICAASFGQDSQSSQPAATGAAEPVLVVDAGPCTADFVIRDSSGKGIYDAKITLQAQYGFMGMRKLDLNVGTNSDGKARIEGLPEKIRRAADFKISQGQREKSIPYDPVSHCYAMHQIILDAPENNQTN